MTETTQSTEYPGKSAEGLMRATKRATRKYYTADEKIRIVLEGLKREVSIADLCRREEIHANVYYRWNKDFMEGGKARLQGDSLRQANTEDVKGLRQENERLKLLLAEQFLEAHLLKKSLVLSGEGGMYR